MMTRPTEAEMSLIADIKLRRNTLSGQPLVIEGRLFSDDVRLEKFELENTQFINCNFVGCTMLQGTLRNVSFANCLFVANLWENGPWDEVSFSGCAWRGHFKMGSAAVKGNVRFDDCEFIGSTPEEMGYGGKADTFGAVGATDGDVSYSKCRFRHTYINGGTSLHVKSSILNECNLVAAAGARLLVEDVMGSGFIAIEAAKDIFSSINVRDSKFSGPLSLEDIRIGTGTFERLVADLNLSIVKADKIDVHNVTFISPDKADPQFRYGFDTQSARIGSLNIIDCDFRGPAATLCLGGEAEIRLDHVFD